MILNIATRYRDGFTPTAQDLERARHCLASCSYMDGSAERRCIRCDGSIEEDPLAKSQGQSPDDLPLTPHDMTPQLERPMNFPANWRRSPEAERSALINAGCADTVAYFGEADGCSFVVSQCSHGVSASVREGSIESSVVMRELPKTFAERLWKAAAGAQS